MSEAPVTQGGRASAAQGRDFLSEQINGLNSWSDIHYLRGAQRGLKRAAQPYRAQYRNGNGPRRVEQLEVHAGERITMRIDRKARLTAAAFLIASALLWGWGASSLSGAESARAGPDVVFTADDRVLILPPHPDDETLMTGGVIQKALSAGAAVRVCYLTFGDGNEWSFTVYRKFPVIGRKPTLHMGEVRHGEALAALKELGVPATDVVFLGYPDFGTLDIWLEHWGDAAPIHGIFTRATSVPYENAYSPGAPYKGQSILDDLTGVIRDFRPTKIFVSHPADQNPDHEAYYLFTRVALWDLFQASGPDLFPALVHYPEWPAPLGYHPEDPLEPPRELERPISWFDVRLASGEERVKDEALHRNRSQMDYAAWRLLSFIRTDEIFGDYPDVKPVQADTITRLRGEVARMPDELTREEHSVVVGFEERWVSLHADTLIHTVVFSRPLGDEVTADVHAFGYRGDVPFAQMPKLNVSIGILGERAYDQSHRLPDGTVKMRRTARQVTMRIPLAAMGWPERVFLGGRTRAGFVPLGWASWRIVHLPRAPESGDGGDSDSETKAEPLGNPTIQTFR
jgi:LmbE family N-acetylglucosaminyl deacetylase